MISESADLALKHKAPKLLISTTVAATLKAFLLPYARYFRSLGWTVDAMARDVASDETCLDAFDHCWDIPWSRSPLDPRNLLHAPSLIQNIVKREGYDIVHVHTPVAAFVTRFALRNRSVDTFPKIVYTAHGFHFYKGGQALRNCIFLNLEKLAGKWTDKLIVINQEDYDAAALHHIVPQEDRVYMPGIGLDLEEYRRAPASETVAKIRSELGLQADDTLFYDDRRVQRRQTPPRRIASSCAHKKRASAPCTGGHRPPLPRNAGVSRILKNREAGAFFRVSQRYS